MSRRHPAQTARLFTWTRHGKEGKTLPSPRGWLSAKPRLVALLLSPRKAAAPLSYLPVRERASSSHKVLISWVLMEAGREVLR